MDSVVGRVRELWRFPVKSMLGERIDSATVTPLGFEGDRGWAVADPESGSLLSAKRVPDLLRCRARTAGPEEVEIELPDGTTVSTADPEKAGAALSALLGGDVRLVRADPHGQAAYQATEDLADDSSPMVTFPTPPGTFFDGAHLLVLAVPTLGRLAAAHPEGSFDVRRFRPNVLVDSERDGFSEGDWVGSTLRVGSAEAIVVSPCPRCVVTTRAQEDLPRDKAILATAARLNHAQVGAYAFVRTPGTVRTADELRLLPE